MLLRCTLSPFPGHQSIKMAPPPTPFHILRAHSTALSCLAFSENNSHLLAGDQDGTVSVTDLGARRVLASWHAHEGGVLGVGEWARGLVR